MGDDKKSTAKTEEKAKPTASAYDKALTDLNAKINKLETRIDEAFAEIARVREARGRVVL